jgi:hypothetical protein
MQAPDADCDWGEKFQKEQKQIQTTANTKSTINDVAFTQQCASKRATADEVVAPIGFYCS